MPPFYTQHPLVRGAPPNTDVHPAAVYMDGVAFQRQDGVLGIWLHLLLCNTRHLLCAIRRSEMCTCGCKGWCTLQPIFVALAWSLAAMASGTHPQRQHDGREWSEADGDRYLNAGLALGYMAVCVLMKGDWSEYSHTLGLPSWADSVAPCPFCFATKDNWFDFRGLSALSVGHCRKTLANYEAACELCEHHVQVTNDLQQPLRDVMAFEKASSGPPRGRVLQCDMDVLGLAHRDRLEPSLELPDTALFESTPTPYRATFWRAARDTITRRRNPLLRPWHWTGHRAPRD